MRQGKRFLAAESQKIYDMDLINTQQVKKKSKYIKWIKLDKPITVTIDGQTGEGNIIKPLEPIEEKMDEHETSGI